MYIYKYIIDAHLSIYSIYKYIYIYMHISLSLCLSLAPLVIPSDLLVIPDGSPRWPLLIGAARPISIGSRSAIDRQ